MQRKIINDPVYGFITIDNQLIFDIINHPWYQRLRRIHQMAMAQLVYPGAVHTRLHHSLGAYHLMRYALFELTQKGIAITEEEQTAAKIAILLHDIGHGPYSHALEGLLIKDVHHESLSLAIMHELNKTFDGKLDIAIAIFKDEYPKRFLHQLISGQLDVDRMDYLTRDSFYSGVSEGTVAYDRILKMITVHQGDLMVEEKAIFSIEKFLVARRLMYWQVYLHKTVLVAEQMLKKIMIRAREINASPIATNLANVMSLQQVQNLEDVLPHFCLIDDYDVLTSIKHWTTHEDIILSDLCTRLINRDLYKIKFIEESDVAAAMTKIKMTNHSEINEALVNYYVFSGKVKNVLYKKQDEKINILFKNGEVKDISQVDNALVHQHLAAHEEKNYICYISK